MKFLVLPLLTLVFATSATNLVSAAGWRTDGTGLYPEAKPVLEWSADQNVIWKTKMPDWGNSMPVLVGDKLFLNVEPDKLVAVSAKDGSILWTASTPMEVALTTEQAEKMEQNKAEVEKIEADLQKLNRDLRNQRRVVRGAEGEEKEKAQAKEMEMRTKQEALMERLASLGVITPRTHPANGYTSPTPVSNGEQVFVNYGTGVVAAYDMEGKLRWAKLYEQPDRGFGHSTSPLLVDGKLITHIKKLMALDPATGEIVWTADLPEAWGTSAVAKIGDTTILLTPNGEIVRASDGKVLTSGLFRLPYGSPIIQDGIIYAVDQGLGAVAFQLPDQIEGDQVEVTELWKSSPPDDRYYSSPVVVDDVLYVMNRTRHLSAIDAKTGEILFSEELDMGRGQQLYGSFCLAGDHLFVSHDSGYTAVVKPGRSFDLVGINSLEPTRSTPIFEGDRIYFRTDGHLFSLGNP